MDYLQDGLREEDILHNIPSGLLVTLLDNPYESLILIDADGIVRFMSSATEGVYPVPPRDAVGRHISEVSPESKLQGTLETGKAEIGRSMVLKDRQRVIARVPLIRDGRVIGAFGKLMFWTPRKLKELYSRIDTLENRLDYYKEELNHQGGVRYSFDTIVGRSDLIKRTMDMARQAAEVDSPVVITGESGTGKELFAHAIHQASRRRDSGFIKVNCSSIPADLFEAELFGYEGGSFTGARKTGKPGKFELADKGTIFLDEIGEMPHSMQVKLMRVLQEKEIDRIGSSRPRNVDFRLICATNRDLEKMIRTGGFRLDLYYRINVINIKLPALRELKEDIPLIFGHFLEKLSRDGKRSVLTVAPEAVELLKNYAWPGNIRELSNIAERAMILSGGDVIEPEDLPLAVRIASTCPQRQTEEPISSLKGLLEETERRAIVETLQKTGNNRAKTAQILGIHRTGLYQKMKKYKID
ncbi:MAG: sigma 54-interacting transcriptional regulator [Syntrophobacteraceae bacterium]